MTRGCFVFPSSQPSPAGEGALCDGFLCDIAGVVFMVPELRSSIREPTCGKPKRQTYPLSINIKNTINHKHVKSPPLLGRVGWGEVKTTSLMPINYSPSISPAQAYQAILPNTYQINVNPFQTYQVILSSNFSLSTGKY